MARTGPCIVESIVIERLRVGGDLHRRAAQEARRRGVALNELVIRALRRELHV
ncbi:toxin-antitoxin system HicB family antitoxin [Castellaniella sp. S9]|uniref:toxin-antitoxin system HicB family antitoxin n=1 Tax=Castellaniella sp. S9 TaxID=2993652 RepID=UPI003FA4A7A2